MTKTISYTTMTVPDFLENFAGRQGIGCDDIYDETKKYKIAECNRDYVWPGTGLQEGFIRDILNKDAVPSIIICNGDLIDAGNRGTTLWLFGKNRLTVDEMTLDTLSRSQFGNWSGCPMPVTIIENATEDEKASYYEKYNKGIVLTFGQKLENRKKRPLVAMAMSMIGRQGRDEPPFPLRGIQDNIWTSRFGKTKGRGELGFAFRILVASMRGPNDFHADYGRHSKLIMSAEVPDLTRLRLIYSLIQSADPANIISQKIKKNAFRLFIGAVILDTHRMDETALREKWVTFFQRVYNNLTPIEVKNLCKATSRHRAAMRREAFAPEDYPKSMSEIVARYLATGEIATADIQDTDETDDESVDA